MLFNVDALVFAESFRKLSNSQNPGWFYNYVTQCRHSKVAKGMVADFLGEWYHPPRAKKPHLSSVNFEKY